MKMGNVKAWLIVGMLSSATFAWGAPMLGLVKAGTEATSESLPSVPSTYSLDVTYNSDGNTISLLTYWIAGPSGVTYGTPPVTALGNASQAFQAGDLLLAISNGDPLTTWTFWGKASGEYAATTTQHIATVVLNTSSLIWGYDYVFTPMGEEAANDSGEYTPFASPGAFTLMLPEPSTSVLLMLGSLVLLRRRR